MLIGILITIISMYYQQVIFKKNEAWREANRPFVIDRREFAMPGYAKNSTLSVIGIIFGLLIILISLVCKFIMW